MYGKNGRYEILRSEIFKEIHIYTKEEEKFLSTDTSKILIKSFEIMTP